MLNTHYFVNFAVEPININMNKLFAWLKESNRWKHNLGGIIIGVLADSNYCAALAGLGIAAALEYKDKVHGGKWDWIDFGITCTGVIVGRLIRLAICGR